MGLQIAHTAGYTKQSVTSSGICVGYCLGNFVDPLVFNPKDAPVYPGFIVVPITSIVATALSIVYRYVCIWHNKERDKTGIMRLLITPTTTISRIRRIHGSGIPFKPRRFSPTSQIAS
ncbi:hypothetical protein CC80DRAFT_498381 [Byssothecium circinans]|uniref:Uncharacterized protein n=1 Tax=Byssothecium circinans TaxID=147558 RepID=A0A6A5T7R7_9PLEO|nr:hypothetical protein CC80DRAFT_498381 [Byssothecium circinans]